MHTAPPFLHPHTLHSHVTAFSTLRSGGVSKGQYASFNICHYTGDNPADVEANRSLLATHLGIPATHIILPRQTHSTEVRLIDAPPQDDELQGVDALITQTPRLCIGVSTADCIPILLYDPVHRTLAAIHAGWRGTVGKIVRRTIGQMQAHCRTRPTDLIATIGPGISREAYEVGEELPRLFEEAGFPLPHIAEKRNGSWHLDLPAANRIELLRCGLPENQITHSRLCTHTHNDRFFSARRQGIHSGRIYTALMLRA